MQPGHKHHAIDYVEFPAKDFEAVQAFYGSVFGWRFESYGDEYLAFFDQHLEGGFYRSESCSQVQTGAALVVFYSHDLEATGRLIEQQGGVIVQPVFDFPGGRRFGFRDPCGNELAVWSDKS